MNLWLVGMLALSSTFIIGGWARAAWLNRSPVSVWNVRLALALGLDLSALSFAGMMGLRTWELGDGTLPNGFFDGWMTVFLSLLLVSKVTLVWVASVAKGHRVTLLWPVYWVAVAAWSLFCGVR